MRFLSWMSDSMDQMEKQKLEINCHRKLHRCISQFIVVHAVVLKFWAGFGSGPQHLLPVRSSSLPLSFSRKGKEEKIFPWPSREISVKIPSSKRFPLSRPISILLFVSLSLSKFPSPSLSRVNLPSRAYLVPNVSPILIIESSIRIP